MAPSGSADRQTPWYARVGLPLAAIWLGCYVEYGLAHALLPFSRYVFPVPLADGRFSELAAATPPNNVLYAWFLRWMGETGQYALAGIAGVILYGIVLVRVRIPTLSLRGGLVVLLFVAAVFALTIVNVFLMFPLWPWRYVR